jgi:fucose permease
MTKRYPFLVLLVFLVFFVISFLTNILGPLVPDIIDGFHLSLALAGFLPFAFFVAYGVMSIPAGMLLERYGEKAVMVAAFVLAFAGSLLFATTPTFTVALSSLFLIGIGMTMLQVAINPLLRVAGGEEHFAFYSVAAQLVFGAASFLSPLVYSYLVTHLKTGGDAAAAAAADGSRGPLLDLLARHVPAALPWVSLYWVFAVVTLLMVALLGVIRLPTVELKADERPGAWQTHRELLANRTVWLFFVAIFCYVGSEQGIANWISKFLATYHGFDPQVQGAHAVAMFWGLMTAGCLLGLLLLKLFDSRRVLVGFAVAAIVTLSAALFGPAQVSYYSFMTLGFCLSVMWSVVFSLALNSVPQHHGSFSGILCTGIVGGAFVSLLIGWLGDRTGLRTSMMVLYGTLGYILSVGLWARPLVANATVPLRELLRSPARRREATAAAAVRADAGR